MKQEIAYGDEQCQRRRWQSCRYALSEVIDPISTCAFAAFQMTLGAGRFAAVRLWN